METGALPALQRFQRGERCRIDPAVARNMVFMTGGAFSSRAQGFLDSVPNVRLDKPLEMQRLRELVRASVGGSDTGE